MMTKKMLAFVLLLMISLHAISATILPYPGSPPPAYVNPSGDLKYYSSVFFYWGITGQLWSSCTPPSCTESDGQACQNAAGSPAAYGGTVGGLCGRAHTVSCTASCTPVAPATSCTPSCSDGYGSCTASSCSSACSKSCTATTTLYCTSQCSQPTATCSVLFDGTTTLTGSRSGVIYTASKSSPSTCVTHTGTIGCTDVDGSASAPVSVPSFKLHSVPTPTLSPSSLDVAASAGGTPVSLSWTVGGCAGDTISCTLGIDRTLPSNVTQPVTCSGASTCTTTYNFPAGDVCDHQWNVTCKDNYGQNATSGTGTINLMIASCMAVNPSHPSATCKVSQDISAGGDCLTIDKQKQLTLDCQGKKISGTSGTGILLTNSNNTLMKNCFVSGFSTDIAVRDSLSTTVDSSTVEKAGTAGIEVTRSNTTTLSSVTFQKNTVGANVTASYNPKVTSCKMTENTVGFYAGYSNSTELTSCSDISKNGDGAIVDSSRDFKATSDTFSSNTNSGLTLTSSPKATLSSSTFYSNTVGAYILQSDVFSTSGTNRFHDNIYGLSVERCNKTTISGAEFYNDSEFGIDIAASNGTSISGVNVHDFPSSGNCQSSYHCIGILLDGSNFTTISGYSTFQKNTESIRAVGSRNTTIFGNSFSSDNSSIVMEDSEKMNITENTITGAGNSGIQISGSKNAIIYTNTITGCGIGIYFTTSSTGSNSNCLFFNNYLDNAVNANGQGDTSTIGGNIPKKAGINVLGCTSMGGNLGGNAWFDPSGGGESTTCDDLDGDCLCDEAYSINGLGDSLPLATNQGFEFTISLLTIDGKTAGSADQYSGKTYVATTTDPHPDVAFSANTIFPGTFTCTSSLGGSTSGVAAGDTGTISISPAITTEGCREVTVTCVNSLVSTNSNTSAPSYFCLDQSPPSVTFLSRSESRGKVTNPTDGETLGKHSLTLKANLTDSVTFGIYCTLEWNGTNQTFAPTLSDDGRYQYCIAKMSNLTNGTYAYRMFAMDAGENIGVTDNGALRTVTIDAPPLSGGCEDCENLGNFSQSTIFLTLNKAQSDLKVVFYSENSSTGDRTLLAGVPIIVWVTNSTYQHLSKIITGSSANDLGVAHFNYSQWNQTTMDYEFMYCCYFEDCGFDMCINGFGVDWDYMDANHMYDMFTIPNATSHEPDLNITQLDILPAVESMQVKPDVCKPTDIVCKTKTYQDALCTPIALLFGFLMAALYYTGRNPFGFLDSSPLRIGSHIRYNPRGAQTGLRITASQGIGLASSATNSVVGAVKDIKKSGGKMSAGNIVKQMGSNSLEAIKASAKRDTNMVKLLFSPVALVGKIVAAPVTGKGSVGRAWDSFAGTWMGGGSFSTTTAGPGGSAQMRQIAAGSGILAHLINCLVGASNEGHKGKTFFGKLGRFSWEFAKSFVGVGYVMKIVNVHKAHALINDAQKEAIAKSQQNKQEYSKATAAYAVDQKAYEKKKTDNEAQAAKKAAYDKGVTEAQKQITALGKIIIQVKNGEKADGEKLSSGEGVYKDKVFIRDNAKGENVKQLQNTINAVISQGEKAGKSMGNKIEPTGVMDDKTKAAIVAIQKTLSLDSKVVDAKGNIVGTGEKLEAFGKGKSDGVVGIETYSMMKAYLAEAKAASPEAPKALGPEPVKPEAPKEVTRLDVLRANEQRDLLTARSDQGATSLNSEQNVKERYSGAYNLDRMYTQTESSMASGSSGGAVGIFAMNFIAAAFNMNRVAHEGMYQNEVKDVMQKEESFRKDLIEVRKTDGTTEKMTKMDALNNSSVSPEKKQSLQNEYNHLTVQISEAAHVLSMNSAGQTTTLALNSSADTANPEFEKAMKKAAADPNMKSCEKLEDSFNAGKGSVASAEAIMKEMAKGDGVFAPAATAALEKMKQYEGNPEAKAGAAREFIGTMALASEQFSGGLVKDMSDYNAKVANQSAEVSKIKDKLDELAKSPPEPTTGASVLEPKPPTKTQEFQEKLDAAERKLNSIKEDNPLLDPKYSDARQGMLQDAVAKYIVTNTTSPEIINAHEGTGVAENLAKYAAAVKDISQEIPALETQRDAWKSQVQEMKVEDTSPANAPMVKQDLENEISSRVSSLETKAAEIGMTNEVQGIMARYNSAQTFDEKRDAAIELNDKVYNTAIANAQATTKSFMDQSANYLTYSQVTMPGANMANPIINYTTDGAIIHDVAEKVNVQERIRDFVAEEDPDNKGQDKISLGSLKSYLAANPTDRALMEQNGISQEDLMMTTDEFAKQTARQSLKNNSIAGSNKLVDAYADSGIIASHHAEVVSSLHNFAEPEAIQKAVNEGIVAEMERTERAERAVQSLANQPPAPPKSKTK